MRRLGHPLEVRCTPAGDPAAMRLGGCFRPVALVLDRWVECGRWWDGEERRRFWRVDAGGLFDLSCDELGCWRVEAVWD